MTQNQPHEDHAEEGAAAKVVVRFTDALWCADLDRARALAPEVAALDASLRAEKSAGWYEMSAWDIEAMRIVASTGTRLPESMQRLQDVVWACTRRKKPECLQFVLSDPQGKRILQEPLRLEQSVSTAASHCRRDLLQIFADHGVALGAVYGLNRNLLHCAVAGPRLNEPDTDERFSRMTDFLLSHGAEIDLLDAQQRSPLALAASQGETVKFACLLARGASPYAGAGMRFPIRIAASVWEPDMLEQVQAAGLDLRKLEADREDRRTLLHDAASRIDDSIDDNPDQEAKFQRTVEILRGIGIDLEARDSRGMTPLLASLAAGDGARVRALLDAGADLNAKDNAGQGVEEHLQRLSDPGIGADTSRVRAVIYAWRARSAIENMMSTLARPDRT